MIKAKYPDGIEPVMFEDGRAWVSHDGRPLKGVSRFLDTVWPMPHGLDPWYLERGGMVHLACALIATGKLDRGSIDQRIYGFVSAAEDFVRVARPVFEAVELIVIDRLYRYGGRIDAVVRFKSSDRPVILDWKCGDGREARYWVQLAAYAQALDWEAPKTYDRAIVNLRKNGTSRITFDDEPAAHDRRWKEILMKEAK